MRPRRIDRTTLAAGLGVDSEHLMWRAANENESQLSSARQTTCCLQHFDLLVSLSARALFEKFSSCSPFALPTAPSSSNFAGFNKWATIRRIDLSGGVTSSGVCLGPPGDTGRSVAARLYLVASVSLDACKHASLRPLMQRRSIHTLFTTLAPMHLETRIQ
jgi:hypothetical protein